MRSIICFGLLCAAVTLIRPGSAEAASEDCTSPVSADEAQKAEEARYSAQTTNDFAAMQRLFADDLVYAHSSAAVDDKASFIETMRSGATRYRTMRRSETKVRTYGCVAILTGKAEFQLTARGQELTIPLRFSSVWVKRAAGLQFVSWQSTRVPQE
jgi:hypothetical protein